MSSSLPLFLNPSLRLRLRHKPLFFSSFSLSSSLAFKTVACSAASGDRDDSLWLREEQRWLREEQRWLREESRWSRERDALLRRISELELRIQAMDRRSSIHSDAETVASVDDLVEVLEEKSLIAETGSSASPLILEETENKVEEMVKEVVVDRVVRVSSEETKKKKKKKKRSSLRKGSQGEEVRALQEALEKLGFYSGEEDMEYSCFSSGTERAVKTWQATIDIREDGIMTEELLDRLLTGRFEEEEEEEGEGANGAAFSGVFEITKSDETAVKFDNVSQNRVFLLGENRWEEPSRLIDSNKSKGISDKSSTRCISCRGEGRLLCTECDGTGEPNVEEQFMEWVDEGAACPYCEGLGYTICDVCGGNTVI